MSNRKDHFDHGQNQRSKKSPKKGNPEKLQIRGRKSQKKPKNGKKSLERVEHDFADEGMSNAFESMSKAAEPELSHKKSLNDDDDTKDIQYLKEEYEEFKSLKNIFVNRKQFIHLAKIHSPAYKIREKEKEREKAKNSKSKFKKANALGLNKETSFSKGMDRSTINDDDATAGDDEDLEEVDPRIFKLHGKTFRF